MKTELAPLIQLHMHEFPSSVSLLGSSRDTALYSSDEELRYKPWETTVQQKNSNPHKEVKITSDSANTFLYQFWIC